MTVRRGTVLLTVGAGLSVAVLVAAVVAAGSGKSAPTSGARGTSHATSTAATQSTAGSRAASEATSAARTPAGSSPTRKPTGSTPMSAAALAAVGLRQYSIPATTSHFKARPAVVYLPPAAKTHPSWRFPVVELLIGTGGTPSNWQDRGALSSRMAVISKKFNGKAPVVVVVDENGYSTTDSECVDRRHGDAEKYLAVDVPRWIYAHLPVKRGRDSFAISGLSEGGTCALMLALRFPSVWQTFDDISGLKRPTVGEDDNRAKTIKVLFGGNAAAYDAHDPTYLLRTHRYPTTRGELYYGTGDGPVVRDMAVVRPLLARAGAGVRTLTQPGLHKWPVFGGGLSSFLGWWYRG